jgi:hypothetical protein
MTKIFLILSFIILSSNQIFGQKGDDVKYKFAKEVFDNNYTKTNYEKYEKEVLKIDSSTYKFEDKIIVLEIGNSRYEKLFQNGIFNPDIIFGKETSKLKKSEIDSLSLNQKVLYNLTRNDSLAICCFEELEKLTPNPQTKRFKFWVLRNEISNPTEYYIELYNGKARKETSLEDFIENSRMTFYYKGTLII